jgi:TPP-dependent pyruvate/acetoin dehydrogenase alpha subunit
MKDLEIYKKIYIIRLFEKLLLYLFDKGLIKGTTHTSIGQELISVLALSYVDKKDYVISNHRSHAHFISYSENYEILLDEILGNKNGMCHGKGGSQHIHYKRFYSNGVLGNLVPVANGLALGEKLRKRDGIAVLFIGDGTFGQGIVYESLNLSKLLSIPIIYIVENNYIAQTTTISENMSGNIKDRFLSFNIPCDELDDQNIDNMKNIFFKNFKYARTNSAPVSIVVNTQRLGAHSKGDDSRDKNFIEEINKKDPLIYLKNKINKSDLLKVNNKIKNEFKKKLKERKIDGSAFFEITE